jgi:hypothetical protein
MLHDLLPDILLHQRVEIPFWLWIILTIITLGLALVGFIGKSNLKGAINISESAEVRASTIVTEVMEKILNCDDENLRQLLMQRGVDAEQHDAFIEMGKVTLDTFFSKDEDKQSFEGMIAHLDSRGIPRELAAYLLASAFHLWEQRSK